MTHEIKFRAYSETFKSWHHWDVYGEYPRSIYSGLSLPQQFTGLTDRYVQDIYAGNK